MAEKIKDKISEKWNGQMDKKQEQLKVSIIIPVYNTSKFLAECLDSVLKQTYKNVEVICVDDGSTDASLSILAYYAKQDKRVKYFHQENQGQSIARNLGLQHAEGAYVGFLDSDDYLIPSAIQQCVEIISRTGVDMVLFNLEMFLPSGVHFSCFSGPLYENSSPILSTRDADIAVNFTNAAAGLFRRSMLQKNNIAFREKMIYEDWVFMVDVMSSDDHRLFWLNSPLYWYRRDYAVSTTNNITMQCLDLFKAYTLARQTLEKAGRVRQYYINDEKILNESIGFLNARLFDCTDETIITAYLNEQLKYLRGFTRTYFLFLCSYLHPERQYVAKLLYEQATASEVVENKMQLFMQVKAKLLKFQKQAALKQKLKSGKDLGKRILKKLMHRLLPAYHVISNTREKVELLMAQVDYLNTKVSLLTAEVKGENMDVETENDDEIIKMEIELEAELEEIASVFN